MPLKQKMDQETQVHSARTAAEYVDTQGAGAGMETPADVNKHLLWDLNNLRSQVARIMDPATPADWFNDMAAAGFDSFGLKQIHDKKLAFDTGVRPGTSDFTLSGTPGGVLVDATLLPSGSPKVAVGPSSAEDGGYIAADEANFTVVGTLGVGLSQAADAAGIILNRVAIVDDATNAAPQTGGGEDIFGLLQVINGAADGVAVAAAASENLQISFAFIDPATDVITATTLPAGDYHFATRRLASFFNVPVGLVLGGAGLPEIVDPAAVVTKLPFREIDITGTLPAADDPMTVTTGTFVTAGAQTVFSSFGTPALPATGAAFRDDPRVKIWLNGQKMSKGASGADNRDVYFVSATQFSFEDKLKNGDVVHLESPSSF